MNKSKITNEMKLKMKELYLGGMSSYKVADEVGVTQSTVLSHLKKMNVELRLSGITQSRAMAKNLKLTPSNDMAYLLGVLEGDGFLYKSGYNYIFGLKVTDKDFVESFKHTLSNLGFQKTHDRIVKSKNENWNDCYEARVKSKPFYDWYWGKDKEYGCIYKYYREIFNTPEMKAKFVQGMFDSEGTVYFVKGGHVINISNTDYDLIELMAEFIGDLGIKYSIYHEPHEDKKDAYKIYIKAESAKDFIDKIGTNISRKNERLQTIYKKLS